MRPKSTSRGSDQRGFTLTDLLVVMALMAIVAGMTVMNVQRALADARGDNAMVQVAGTLRQAREAAIAQRRPIDVLFVEPNRIQVLRNEIPDGETILADLNLEGTLFDLDATLPDTPDDFGNESPVDFGGAAIIQFRSDGVLVDETGLPLNGTVFLMRPGELASARAITVTGGSGRTQGYRWMGRHWEAQ
jgi:prepilin-type N-terminal cleavage/methylation domain-containing protein